MMLLYTARCTRALENCYNIKWEMESHLFFCYIWKPFDRTAKGKG